VYHLDRIYRADDNSDEAIKARDQVAAEDRHAGIVRDTTGLTTVKVNRLQRWSVAERPVLAHEVD